MEEPVQNLEDLARGIFLKSGDDWFSEQRGLSMSRIDFKVIPSDPGGVLILENAFEAPGGPPRHLHFDQDEWFYALEGEFLFEVGQDQFRLQPGDSLLAPRRVPHVWAHTGLGHGRILVGFTPAGQMEAFFRQHMRGSGPPSKDPEIWRAHGMQLLGPPLSVQG
jgi:mannose-6-phosphate isomerase-like protein (cupin superfamily)